MDSKLEESVIVEEEVVASDNSTQQQSVNVAVAANKIVHPHEAMKPSKRPIGQMIFSPEAPQMHEVSKFKLTIDKKYPIYEKRISNQKSAPSKSKDCLKNQFANLYGEDKIINENLSIFKQKWHMLR